MPVYVALLRGINVGGNNLLPMKEWAASLVKLGYDDVRTYIQSGNAVFRASSKKSAEIEASIAAAITKAHGFTPRVLVLSAGELEKAITANPFPEAQANHKSLHFFFLASTPKADVEALNGLKAKTESFVVTKRVFYLHAPDGVGNSKLAARAEKLLGVPATARNWQTVFKLAEMVLALR